MSATSLLALLDPLFDRFADLDLAEPSRAAEVLNEQEPVEGLGEIRAACLAGMEEGWLLPKEAGGVRFGRLAKDHRGHSIDAVWMQGPGPLHRHPKGEIDLCFALDGEPRFDGNAEGWTVYGQESQHAPTVKGGSMLILYFLPEGQIEFLGG